MKDVLKPSNYEFTKVSDMDFTEAVITVVDIQVGHFMFSVDGRIIKSKRPANDTWRDVYLEPGDQALVVVSGYGLNGLSRALSFIEYISVPNPWGDDTEAPESDTVRTKRPHKKHKWTVGRVEKLIVAVSRGIPLSRLSKNSAGFTRDAIYSKLYKLGYRVKNDKAIFKI